MASQRHKIRVGDTLTPLARQLKQKGTNGILGPVNLTGCTVKFSLCDESGTKVIDESATGVTVTDAAHGYVKYDFQLPFVLSPGEYHAYFHVYSSGERDTFPAPDDELIVQIGAID